MSVINPPRAPFVPFQVAYTGAPARTAYGAAAYQTFQNLRNWRSAEFIAHYIGRPDADINGNDESQFHIITGSPPPADGTTRDIVFLIDNWRKNYEGSGVTDEEIVWYDTIGGSADTLFSEPPIAGGTDDTYISGPPLGRKHRLAASYTPVTSSTDDGFKLHRLDINGAVVCNLYVFSSPLLSKITDDQAITISNQYTIPQTLKGFDVTTSEQGTVGAIMHNQQNGDAVVQNSRRALFNQPYALGTYTERTSWSHFRTNSNDTPAKYKVKPREHWSGTNLTCDIAICATIDVPVGGDAGIRLKSVTANDTWTYTTSSDLTTPTLITTSDGSAGLDVAIGGDEITVEGYADSGGHVKLHTVSLWEPLAID